MEEKDYLQPEIKLYSIRWLILAIFALSNMMTSVIQLSFASIQNLTLDYFNLGNSTWKVNLMSVSYMAFNIPGSVFAGIMIKGFGLGFTVNLANICHFIACSLRFLGCFLRNEYGFWVVFSGNLIGACVNTCITCSTTQVSSVWFGETERTLATTISSFTNMFGIAFVFGLSMMVGINVNNMPWYLLIQLIITAIIAIPSIIFFRSKPPTPSNYASLVVEKNSTLWEDYGNLLQDINFLIIAFVFSFAVGSLNSFISLLNQYVTPKGYSPLEASLFGVFIIGFGIFGSVFFGIIASKTKKIRMVIWICAIASCFSFIGFVFVLQYNRTTFWFIMALIFTACIGIFGPIIVPLMFELGAETSFPIQSSVSNVFMVQSLNFVSITFVFIQDFLQEKKNGRRGSMTNSLYFCVGTLIFSIIIFLFWNGKFKRMENEDKERNKIN